MSPSWRTAAWLALLSAALSAADDKCDLEFMINSTSQQPSYFASTHHYVNVDSLDGNKPNSSSNGGCTLNFLGSGCTWQRSADSAVGDYTVSHSTYSPFGKNEADVTIKGNDCDGTKLLCRSDNVQVEPVVPPDDGAPILIYTAETVCRLTRPEAAPGQPDGATYATLIQGLNDFDDSTVQLPADPAAQYIAVADAPQPGPVSCTSIPYNSDGCYDAHWYCGDAGGGAAYPTDAPVSSSMTAAPTVETTYVAGNCETFTIT